MSKKEANTENEEKYEENEDEEKGRLRRARREAVLAVLLPGYNKVERGIQIAVFTSPGAPL